MPRQPASRKRRAANRTPYQSGARQGGGDREETEVVRLATDSSPAGREFSPFQALFPLESSCGSGRSNFELHDAAFRCPEDDMTMHVSRDLIQKIWSGEYFNLALLLNKSDKSTSAFVMNEFGEIELKQKEAKEVQNIREWTDAFLIFTRVFIKKFPEKAGELLQYMATVRETEAGARGSFAWREYDRKFRMRQAIQPRPWSDLNLSMWLKTMTLQAPSLPKIHTPQAIGQVSGTSVKPIRPCYDFNSIPGCSFRNCKYDHVCLACKGNHAQQNCPRMLGQPFRGQKPANKPRKY